MRMTSATLIFLVRTKGLAPLAARPGAQHNMLCGLRKTCLYSCSSPANRSLPLAPPPSRPFVRS